MITYIAQELFVIPQYFEEILEHFSEELPKLLNKLVYCKEIAGSSQNTSHLPKSVLMGKIVKQRPDLQQLDLMLTNINNFK